MESLYGSTARAQKGAPANLSAETSAMNDVVIAWGKARFPGCRVLTELALGDRRIDIVFVRDDDLIGVEVKGPKDRLGDGRLPAQLREYRYWLPEVWLAVDQRWVDHAEVRQHYANAMVVKDGAVIETPPRPLKATMRDEFCCSRLIELLWNEEAARVAQRCGVVPGPLMNPREGRKVKAMLARLLTGHQIMKAVCTELRARPLVGMASDDPVRSSVDKPAVGLPRPGTLF